MLEIEVKVRADLDPVRRRLQEAGGTRRRTVRQEDIYFDAPHRQFAETDEALRLRCERSDGGRSTILTYKGPRLDDRSKTRREVESSVGNLDGIMAILEGLGFVQAATVEKDREVFALGEYTITLDDVDGLGTFVEVEYAQTGAPTRDGVAPSGDRSANEAVDLAVEEVYEVVSDLGLDPSAQIRTSYLGLLLENNSD